MCAGVARLTTTLLYNDRDSWTVPGVGLEAGGSTGMEGVLVAFHTACTSSGPSAAPNIVTLASCPSNLHGHPS